MAAEGKLLQWRLNLGRVGVDLKVIWEMSDYDLLRVGAFLWGTNGEVRNAYSKSPYDDRRGHGDRLGGAEAWLRGDQHAVHPRRLELHVGPSGGRGQDQDRAGRTR